MAMNRTSYDRARFYPIKRRRLPSVTTILDILNKPGLPFWAAKEVQKHFEGALLEVLTVTDLASLTGQNVAELVLQKITEALPGIKAMEREREKAATIGTATHAGIEWETRRRLREKVGPEPHLPEAAQWAVEAWKDWAKAVNLEPLAVERQVWCEACGYAGTLDLYAKISGELTICDYKTAKQVWPEAFLQNVSYRHAAAQAGMVSDGGLILRLPKRLDDPGFEPVPVPEDINMDEFLSALRLWRWSRRMAGLPMGDPGTGVHGLPAGAGR